MSESAGVAVVGEYYRSRSGATVHLAPCPAMGLNVIPWHYADGRSIRSVAAEVNKASWMRLCRRCWPAAAFADPA